MKKIYILLLGLAIAPAAFAFDGAGMPFNPGLMMYNQAGMSGMHDMNTINEQRYRREAAEGWQMRQNKDKLLEESKVKRDELDAPTMQKLINSKKSKNAEFVQENGELKIEHLE